MRLALFTLAAAVLLSGCATISSPPQIVVETASRGAPAPGAQCVVSSGQGQWSVTTPGAVYAGRPSGDLRVDCRREGLRDTTLIVSPTPFYYAPQYDPMFGSRASLYWGAGWQRRSAFGYGMSFPLGYQEPDRWEYPSRVVVDMAPE